MILVGCAGVFACKILSGWAGVLSKVDWLIDETRAGLKEWKFCSVILSLDWIWVDDKEVFYYLTGTKIK